MLPLRARRQFGHLSSIKKGSGGLRGALQVRAVDWSIEAEALFMRRSSRRNGAAADHLADIAAGKADIAEQVIVEMQKLSIGVPARGALEQRRDQAHCGHPCVWGFGVAAGNGAAYDRGALNRV